MPILEGTPLKISHDFMGFGRVKLLDKYDLVKEGMTSPEGIVFYAGPTVTFADMDLIRAAIVTAVNKKDKVTEKSKIKDLKDDMRANIPFVELKGNNDLATLKLSNYSIAEQGGGAEIVIGATTKLEVEDTGIAGEMKGTYKKPKGAKYLEGWSKLHTDPDTAYALTQVTHLEEIVWEDVAKNVENDYKVRGGSGRRKGGFSNIITASCRY